MNSQVDTNVLRKWAACDAEVRTWSRYHLVPGRATTPYAKVSWMVSSLLYFSFSSLSLPRLCCLDSVPHFPLVRNHDFPNLTNLVGLTLCEDALFECSPPLGNVQRQRWFIYTKEEMCLSFCRLNSVGKSLIFLPVAGCGYHTVKNLSWPITLQVRLLAKQRLSAKTEIVTHCVTVNTLRCLR